jgi:acetyl-CoA synthetase
VSSYGVTVLDYYGLTESYPLVANYPSMEVREGSMGRPMPGWDVQILDEDESPVASGERGEICLRARSNPHYPLGYWNGRRHRGGVRRRLVPHQGRGRPRRGRLHLVRGPADDVIIAAGYRIGPFEVESVCLEHPAVREAAAVASPTSCARNVVKAFIVVAEGHTASDDLAGQIQAHVRERLSAYAYPRRSSSWMSCQRR